MSNSVGVNVTCNSNCNKWCPRVLRVFCCCFRCADTDTTDCDERIATAVSKAVQDVEARHHHKKEKKLDPNRVTK